MARDPATGFYMACLDLAGRPCLVVGGGAVAAEKAAGLLACGARVTVAAERLSEAFEGLEIEWRARAYGDGDLEGMFVVMAASGEAALDERVYADAEARGTLCNVADVPALCSFILPAVHRQGPIAVAVSTGGASPALAKRLRDQIAGLVEPRHAALALELAALRPAVKHRFASYEERRDFFEALVSERLA